MTTVTEHLVCERCGLGHPRDVVRYACDCGGLLGLERVAGAPWTSGPFEFDARLSLRRGAAASGVWRFREAVLDVPLDDVVSAPEGNTRLYAHRALDEYTGLHRFQLKHEGENPTASFKDRGMTVAVTQARRMGARAVACASTGNTSASLAAYAARAGLKAVVFIPAGKISTSKLAQTLAYGATCVQVAGDFDAAMSLVRSAAESLGIYLVNSINPFRIAGQKTIGWELLQDLAWDAPDWVVLPAGNLGNTAAIGRALLEAHAAGWIARVPRLACVQARGANPFFRSFQDGFRTRTTVRAETVASAIRIGDPVSHDRARSVVERTHGVVVDVSDDDILAAKRRVDRAGIGCEPASACSVAGARALVAAGTMARDARVVGILTGHLLKDPDAVMLDVAGEPRTSDQVLQAAADPDDVRRVLEPVLAR